MLTVVVELLRELVDTVEVLLVRPEVEMVVRGALLFTYTWRRMLTEAARLRSFELLPASPPQSCPALPLQGMLQVPRAAAVLVPASRLAAQ